MDPDPKSEYGSNIDPVPDPQHWMALTFLRIRLFSHLIRESFPFQGSIFNTRDMKNGGK